MREVKTKGEDIDYKPWSAVEYLWGAALVDRRTDKEIKVFIKPDEQELNVEGLDIILHENGIEFIGEGE